MCRRSGDGSASELASRVALAPGLIGHDGFVRGLTPPGSPVLFGDRSMTEV